VRDYGCGRHFLAGVASVLFHAACGVFPAIAEQPAVRREPWIELSAGGEMFPHIWSFYTGTAVAPFSSFYQSGLQVRASVGYGAYRYSGKRWNGHTATVATFDGTAALADILLGYQARLGALTLKGFAGASFADHTIAPFDPETSISGRGVGARFVLEAWYNVSDTVWSSLDLSWSTLHDTYSARSRMGWRVVPTISMGFEAGAIGTAEYDTGRAGGFLRYEWYTGEISASGGVSFDREKEVRPFLTHNRLTRF
jgi:hypothetical protein